MTNLEALLLSQKIELRMLRVNQAIDVFQLKDKNMAVSPDVATIIAQFDVASDAIAARIQKLIDTTPSLSADDKAAFQVEVDKLSAFGKDPENPTAAA